MSSKMKISALALGLMGVLGGNMAYAQTAPAAPEQTPAPAPAAPAPAPVAPAVPQTPEILQGDGFSNVEAKPGRRGGIVIEGTLTETGKDFDAIGDGNGNLLGIRTAEGSSLPQSVIDALLPEAARGNPILAEIAALHAIGGRDGAVMLGGQDAAGNDVRVGFDAEGELVLFNRGEFAKRWMRDGYGPRGDDDGWRGSRGEGDHHGKRGHREGGPRERGSWGDAPREGDQKPPVDEAAIRSAVEAAGYTELGTLNASRRGIAVEALNPQGEAVLLVLTPKGEVVRETAR